MEKQYLSITIRPPQAEFEAIKDAIDLFIEYMKPDSYIVSIEKGQKEGKDNHYQMALISARHVDTIRRAINRFFKPHLSPSTLKTGVWKKCIRHNNVVSLVGYCLKEGNVYSTNIEETQLKAELQKYKSQIKAKPEDIPCISPPSDTGRIRLFQICVCKKCNVYYSSREYLSRIRALNVIHSN